MEGKKSELLKWITLNPKLAEERFQELVNGLKKRIGEAPKYQTALVIQEMPNYFPLWKRKVINQSNLKKKNILNEYIRCIEMALTELSNNDYLSEIENCETIKDELTEQLEYWKKELKSLEPQQINIKIKYEPTLKELALYYFYLGVEVNKENQNELLKDFKQKSGAKLKQHYDYCGKTNNRINKNTERKDNHRIKEFENVIKMLKETDNKQAIEKASDEYKTFKTKLV